jgi:glycogen operon protein
MGDEVRRTQRGNNNAYCQDNEISWFDWQLVEKHADLQRFARLLFQRRALRETGPELERESLNQLIQKANKDWHGVKRNQPDWSENSHSLAFSAEIRRQNLFVYLSIESTPSR